MSLFSGNTVLKASDSGLCEARKSKRRIRRLYHLQTVSVRTGFSEQYSAAESGSCVAILKLNPAKNNSSAFTDEWAILRVGKSQYSFDLNFQYAGYYKHARSGLNLTLYRAYNPGLGRWISRDPLGESAGVNLYGYVANNPLLYWDPFGLELRVYTSPAFGGLVPGKAQHVFVYGTEAGFGIGRTGVFGQDWRRRGYPDDFDPMTYLEPYRVVDPDADGKYNGLTESEFLDAVKTMVNEGPYFPGAFDCHSSLENAFEELGVKYPGAPYGRFKGYGSSKPSQYSVLPFPPRTFQLWGDEY